ncbi:PDZ/DHR/GLGF domain protein [Planctopirus limnophila DSM 3776]|uniref:PDZ/DHR/GLGF domain protein n=2 Tax=Planctopirus limnophila TaxID=120 RepID=D5SYB2_PLAL2|nr:PDZ/DHR/GLGF domain protein [Planctopirus limnophila DSM 3776]
MKHHALHLRKMLHTNRWISKSDLHGPGLAWLMSICFLLCGSQFLPAADDEMITEVQPKLVKIFGAGGLRNLYSYNTGFLISSEGHIATIWNHVLDQNTVTVILHDGRRYEGKVLGAEPGLDLAIVKIDETQLEHFEIGDPSSGSPFPLAAPGTRIVAFSNMFKVATGDEPVSVIQGVIAARTKLPTRRGAYESSFPGEVYVIDAITNNPGAGGGIVTTVDGRLLGMIGKEVKNADLNTWVNYAIPISHLQQAMTEIMTGNFRSSKNTDDDKKPAGQVPLFHSTDFGIVMLPNVVPRTPAYVDRILPGSAAEVAGLKPNDLILFVGDELIQSCGEFLDQIGRLESGGKVKLIVRRENALITTELPIPRKSRPPAKPLR